jgi:hypothetical protein
LPDIHDGWLLKRLANCETLDELELLQEELVDRFGLLRIRPGAGRQPSAAHRGESPGHSESRCRTREHCPAIHQGPAHRPVLHHVDPDPRSFKLSPGPVAD